ncbi:monovalent cation/H(+) antiporter subunit G [Halarchaeum sp. CBA1220]|uniref:monovalent cation/H(+) antiporter subunit G n=1 Tax=Halarchaeum sp. CBA1220 TaxID=1853682 RepID=UPI000F3A8CD2|nr:monovalent cation/H(+) antiporter subunit G [Halarchaeum sp. CBA1220]QLC33719.1 monovalent cation/H(+) antiporter subunit G [Halarchaeum sp. CBA1220]
MIQTAITAATEGASEAAHAGPSDLRLAVVAALVLVGTFFLIVGTVGLWRFPDIYNRMHATSKATTLGAASMFLAGFVRFGPFGAGLTSLVGIVFLFATAPTGAHLISLAARRLGVAMYENPDGFRAPPSDADGPDD